MGNDMQSSREKQLVKWSKFLSLVLRHKPEVIGVTLDAQGWTDVARLLQKARAAGVPLTRDDLNNIVETNSKKRFSFNDNFDKIRASQGHSVRVDLGLEAQQPPEFLYHGTAQRHVADILENGLLKQARHHVHLSADVQTALQVGKRHGKPHVFQIMAGKMYREGFLFYISANGVWLTGQVPPQYLEVVDH
jgi:putative RNA 2'-phosphotransferase